MKSYMCLIALFSSVVLFASHRAAPGKGFEASLVRKVSETRIVKASLIPIRLKNQLEGQNALLRPVFEERDDCDKVVIGWDLFAKEVGGVITHQYFDNRKKAATALNKIVGADFSNLPAIPQPPVLLVSPAIDSASAASDFSQLAFGGGIGDDDGLSFAQLLAGETGAAGEDDFSDEGQFGNLLDYGDGDGGLDPNDDLFSLFDASVHSSLLEEQESTVITPTRELSPVLDKHGNPFVYELQGGQAGQGDVVVPQPVRMSGLGQLPFDVALGEDSEDSL